MKQLMITMVRRALLCKSGPTLLLRSIKRTKTGRRSIRWMFHYYVKNKKSQQYRDYKIRGKHDLPTSYHYATLLERLRKNGL